MVIREIGTFLIIAGLTLAFSYTWGLSIWNSTGKDCQASNVEHLLRGAEGPVKPCP